MENVPVFQIGEIVEATKGRDHGKIYIVVGKFDDHFVAVADGDQRTFKTAKKKNINHVRALGFASREVKESLEQTGLVTNAKIRHGLIQYCREKPVIIKEGE
ncbi:hypothetical protein JCM19037_3194 [Geomicrobium sp. JCM 19037]|uniref:KOW domain-containing RNA-binding protein n=1 Tax=unclassified Geomicrobium TaxID=2628951 RepID=UPI00045F3D00|nr:KOW domain-containing RNA-binding protein [Geomicrobium sp. JCM 19037]GAK04752.1 hypothetical protein JCM19037_3194 [Geomicrobium sp. JCM 19037]